MIWLIVDSASYDFANPCYLLSDVPEGVTAEEVEAEYRRWRAGDQEEDFGDWIKMHGWAPVDFQLVEIHPE